MEAERAAQAIGALMKQMPSIPEYFYRLLVDEAVAYAIIFFDREGVIRHWNPGAERLFQYTAEEALGKQAELIFIPEDVRSGVPEREMQTAAATGQAEDRRWKERKDGTRFFADGVLTALRGEDRSVLGFAKIIRDATAEERAEERRTASEAQLRLIVDSIGDYAIYMLDAEGRIETWSRGAQRIKGYTPEEIIGRNFEVFYPPEDVASGKPRRQLRIAAEAGTYDDESLHLRKDGSRFWASVVVSAIRDDEGQLRGFVNLTHDITERKHNEEGKVFLAEASRLLASSIEYEETLRRIARIAVPRVADWCAVDLLIDAGRVLARVAVEHADPTKVELANRLEKTYPADPAASPAVAEVIRERRTLFYPQIPDDLVRASAQDPEHLRIVRELGLRSAIITPLVAADRVLGTIMFVTAGDRRLTEDDVTIAEDVAARAAVAVQNAELYREAQEANRAKDDFLATVSHELRTPMTAVLGWARLLRTETDPEVIAEAALAVERSALAQAQLIDDILDVARIRVGKLKMRFDSANLAEVVAAAVDTVRFTAEAKHVRLRVEMDRGVLPVSGDSQRLQQVVWNLLTNAVKFTPEAGRVDVVLEQEDGKARLTVRDTGPGIPPDFLPHLFERFRQAETTQRRGHSGLGLGLSIAQYIVDAHGGTIRAQSAREGTGATFVVELPTLTAETRRQSRSGRRAKDDFDSLEGVLLIVVEDNGDTLQFLRRALERAGAEVRAASSVDEAMDHFSARVPDVIVSDIAMPKKTGFDLVRTIRESGSEVPIIAVTASGMGGDRDRALSAGFNEYLRKPVEPHVLIQTIRTFVHVQS
jgi:PAS domain S-box-containing protein